jgi:hypothetical protein
MTISWDLKIGGYRMRFIQRTTSFLTVHYGMVAEVISDNGNDRVCYYLYLVVIVILPAACREGVSLSSPKIKAVDTIPLDDR